MNEDEKWSSAAFCAHSDTLPPEQMEVIIGLPPTRSHRIGEPRSKRTYRGVHDRHYYSVQSKISDSEPLEKHIEEILSMLEPRIDRVKHLASEASLCLFCGFSSGNGQGGFVLSPSLLSRLAQLGLEVVLDLYPPEGCDSDLSEETT
jgi:hypothetical protein